MKVGMHMMVTGEYGHEDAIEDEDEDAAPASDASAN